MDIDWAATSAGRIKRAINLPSGPRPHPEDHAGLETSPRETPSVMGSGHDDPPQRKMTAKSFNDDVFHFDPSSAAGQSVILVPSPSCHWQKIVKFVTVFERFASK